MTRERWGIKPDSRICIFSSQKCWYGDTELSGPLLVERPSSLYPLEILREEEYDTEDCQLCPYCISSWKIEQICLFKRELLYLGFIIKLIMNPKYSVNNINTDGFRSDHAKIEAVHEWSVPCFVTDAHTFLAYCNYHHKLIQNYTLVQLACAKCVFHWGNKEQTAFNKLL